MALLPAEAGHPPGPPVLLPPPPASCPKMVFTKTEKIWSYLSLAGAFARSSLNASIRIFNRFGLGCRNLDGRITNIITHMKLMSFISLPFGISSVISASQKVFRSIQLRDGEGIALSSLSFVIITKDLIDTLGTAVNTVRTLTNLAPVAFLSALGTPFGFSLSALGSISRIIQIVKTQSLAKAIFQNVDVSADSKEKVDALRKFAIERLDITDKEKAQLLDPKEAADSPANKALIERLLVVKEAALLRAAPPEAVKELKAILEILKSGAALSVEEAQDVAIRLDKVLFSLSKKTKLDVAYLLCNILTLIGLSLLHVAAVPAALPFCFIATSFLLRILCHIYQDTQTYKNRLPLIALS